MGIYDSVKHQVSQPHQMGTKNFLRPRNPDGSYTTVSMVRVEKGRDGKEIVIQANNPVGIGWNRDGQPQEWKMLAGWMTEDEYKARKNGEEADAKAKAAVEADRKRQEVEAAEALAARVEAKSESDAKENEAKAKTDSERIESKNTADKVAADKGKK